MTTIYPSSLQTSTRKVSFQGNNSQDDPLAQLRAKATIDRTPVLTFGSPARKHTGALTGLLGGIAMMIAGAGAATPARAASSVEGAFTNTISAAAPTLKVTNSVATPTPDGKMKVEITFDQSVLLLDEAGFVAMPVKFNTKGVKSAPRHELIPEIEGVTASGNTVTVILDQQLPEKAIKISIGDGALGNAEGTPARKVNVNVKEGGIPIDQFLLDQRPVIVRPESGGQIRYTTGIFLDASMLPVDFPPAPTEKQRLSEATRLVAKGVKTGELDKSEVPALKYLLKEGTLSGFRKSLTPRLASMKAMFDADPSLNLLNYSVEARSALVASIGIFGKDTPREPHVEAFLGKNETGKPFASFGVGTMPPGFETFAAASVPNPDGSRSIVLNPVLAGHPLAVFVRYFVHEPLHQDTQQTSGDRKGNSTAEETLAQLVDTLAYTRMIVRDPNQAKINARETRAGNQNALAFANSVDANGLGFGFLPDATQPLDPPQVYIGGRPGTETVDGLQKLIDLIVAGRPDVSKPETDCAGNAYLQDVLALTGTAPGAPADCDATTVTHFVNNFNVDGQVFPFGVTSPDSKEQGSIDKANATAVYSLFQALQADPITPDELATLP